MVQRNVKSFQKSESVPGIAWDPSLGPEVQYIFLARPNICGAGNSNTLAAGKIATGVAIPAVSLTVPTPIWKDPEGYDHNLGGHALIVLPGWEKGPGPVMQLTGPEGFTPMAEDDIQNPRRNIVAPGSKNIYVDMGGVAAGTGHDYILEAPANVIYDLPFEAVIDGKVQPVTVEVLKAARPDLYP